MGRKIFVSYKYSDNHVLPLSAPVDTTVIRQYVDRIEELLAEGHHIYKGECDGEDMSELHDSTISTKLGDRIFDSSVTIVLISKGMREPGLSEKDQWIPWEVSYSLREQSREGGRSNTNAMLAVILPDETGSYDYVIQENQCIHCNSHLVKTPFLFQIIRDNMFNLKKPSLLDCTGHQKKTYKGHSSYIHFIKWPAFEADCNACIDVAMEIREQMEAYELVKVVR